MCVSYILTYLHMYTVFYPHADNMQSIIIHSDFHDTFTLFHNRCLFVCGASLLYGLLLLPADICVCVTLYICIFLTFFYGKVYFTLYNINKNLPNAIGSCDSVSVGRKLNISICRWWLL